MPKTLSVLLALSGLCASAFAQEGFPEPTAQPKERGVLEKIFGSRRGQRPLFAPTPAPRPNLPPPAPEPEATPKPVVKKKKSTPAPVAKKRKPKAPAPAVEEPAPALAQATPPPPAPTAPPAEMPVVENPVVESPVVEKPVVEKAPRPAPATPAPTKKTRKGKTAAAAAAPTSVPADVDPETREKLLFDAAKAKASEDPEIMELKAKADGALTDDEARRAQRAYNKALFAKMREIDSSIAGRIKEMEAAVLKRLDAQ